jgi:hypothetical protein
VQILAGTLDEPTMFRVGAALERAAVAAATATEAGGRS